MLLEIRQQKNGTIVIEAPDRTVYAFDLQSNKEPGKEVLQRMGRTLLEILDDPEQPKQTTSAGTTNQAPSGDVEENLRRTLDSAIPGASGILDFLQRVSSDPEPVPPKDETA